MIHQNDVPVGHPLVVCVHVVMSPGSHRSRITYSNFGSKTTRVSGRSSYTPSKGTRLFVTMEDSSRLFLGPNPLAGIGQVTKQYAQLVDGEYCEVGHAPSKTRYDHGFAFVLPIENQLNAFDEYKPLCPSWTYMTVCETEPVNPAYGLLSRYGTIHCPSEFARSTLERQFPNVTWKLLRHYAQEKPHRAPAPMHPIRSIRSATLPTRAKTFKGSSTRF